MGVRLISAAMLAAGVIALAASAGHAESPDGGEETFGYTGSEQQFVVPAGVRSLHVELVGGRGADAGPVPGGRGAMVSGTLEVSPGDVLYVNVGGNGSLNQGGFNGGGPGGSALLAYGGGGGGATDIRTESRELSGSESSRLVVAAGGGGAGANSTSDSSGGKGGAADADGGNGAGPLPGQGGKRGEANAGGAVGASGNNPGGLCNPDSNPTAGLLAVGGAGATGACGAGSGGGGGGGLYGGGGGGAGSTNTTSGNPTSAGGGGGGGGSSLVPEGFVIGLAPLTTAPYAKFAWTLPETVIDAGPKGKIVVKKKKRVRKRFRFSSDVDGARFECRLDGGAFAPCTSPHRVTLKPGRHTFSVRAVQADGNFDPTPAQRAVKVVKKKPKKKRKRR